MKTKLLYIIFAVMISYSCTSNSKKDDVDKNSEITLQTIAAFKSAEHLYENEWKLVFRKIDDCQYILFYADTQDMKTFQGNLFTETGNVYASNPDFINLHFKINYTEEIISDPFTSEKNVIYRLKTINRSRSERFAAAGFEDDTQADDFIMSLKKYIKDESISEISEMISYPITVTIKKKKTSINGPEIFIKEYNSIFNKKIITSILNQPLADIKGSSRGLMIGSGEIWINRIDNKITITSINN